jgi:hypothetical protein
MPEAKTIMRRFQLNEISAVTHPAQEHAKVAFFKADGFGKSRPGVMSKFRIAEISGVDVPAQKGAIATIMKSASPPAGDGAGLPQVDNQADLEREVRGFGRHAAADRPKVKAHLIGRAEALGCQASLPSSWMADASQAEPIPGDEAEDASGMSDVDKSVMAMAKRGDQIRKAQGDRYITPTAAEGSGPTSPKGAEIDWQATKASNLAAIDKAARERAKLDPSKSYARHYSNLLETPNGQAAAAWAR